MNDNFTAEQKLAAAEENIEDLFKRNNEIAKRLGLAERLIDQLQEQIRLIDMRKEGFEEDNHLIFGYTGQALQMIERYHERRKQ